MWWPRVSVPWALCASALLHFGGVVALSDVAPPFRAAAAATRPEPLVIPFEPLVPGTSSGDVHERAPIPPPIVPGGDPLAGNLDRAGPEGRGGDGQALEPGALLFPFVSPLTLQDTELNNLAVSQVQRIHTAAERATQEQRRATPGAADDVLLASGKVGHRERREPSPFDAARGAPAPSLPSMPREAREGRDTTATGGTTGTLVSLQPPQRPARLRPAQGIVQGRGKRESQAAKVTFARPNVDRGPAATPAERIDERVRDDVDAELLAAKLQRSLVDTSVQRAHQVGPGQGGANHRPEALGEIGSGTGARARPYAPGAGDFSALDTGDARYLRWFTQQRERVQRELVFPRARALAKDQGMSLYSVVLGRDGAPSGRPRLIRSSGFADFDAAAALAIERALPFAPLPAELAPEVQRIALLIPVAFANPMID